MVGHRPVLRLFNRLQEHLTGEAPRHRKLVTLLQQSERSYRLLFENNPQPMWVYDPKTLSFMAVNEAAIQHYGYSREEFLSMTIKDIRPPEEVPALLENVSRTAAAFDRADVWRHLKKDGSLIHVEIQSHTLEFAGRQARFVLASDVTQRIEAEQALLRHTREVQDLYNNAPCGYHSLDQNGTLIRVNDTELNWLGYTRDELIGKTRWIELVAAAHRRRFEEAFAHFKEQGRMRDVELELMRKDGSSFPVLINATAVKDDQGSLVMGRSTVFDLTERKRMEDARRESEEKYRVIAETASDAILMIDSRSLIQFANHAAERIFGFAQDDLVGQPLTLLMPRSMARRHELSLKNYLQTGRKRMNWSGIELPALRKDGSEVPVEVSFGEIVKEDGRYFIGIVRDITERKKTEEALKKSEALLQDIIDNSPAVVYVKDAQGKYLLINRQYERVFGVERAMVKNRTDHDLFSREAADRFRTKDRHVLQTAAPLESEEVVQEVDGPHTFISLQFPLLDSTGVAYAVCGISTDITERKLAEEQLRRFNEQLEQKVRERTAQLEAIVGELEAFSYSVSHDLRAPLRSIDGFSQALLEDYLDRLDGTGQDYLRRVRAGSQRMAQLIDDLLNLSYVSRAEMARERINLSALAGAIAQELQGFQPERKATFHIEKDLFAEGDHRLLRIVMHNLLENAWKFTLRRQDALIEFGATKTGGERVFYVRDNGVGFDMKYARKLFGAFQRLHSVSEFPGTGVGLATVRRIITRHNGKVWVDAEVDRGATFYFSLKGESHGESDSAGRG